MSDFQPTEEQLDMARTDRMLVERYNSLYSFPRDSSDHLLTKAMNELVYERILIGCEVRKSYDIGEEVNATFESMETIPLKRSRKYVEMIFKKSDFIKDSDFIDYIQLAAEINDFVFFVLDPVKDKKYYDVESGKIIVNIDRENEHVMWFEHDATDLYFAN